MRTHYCAEVNEEHIGQEVTVAGWVSSRRDHGGLIFIDLRDKDEVIQLVCDPADNVDAHKIAEDVRDQFVLVATGTMRARGEGLENPKLKTGKVEMVVNKLVIENRSKPMPFDLNDEKVNEELIGGFVVAMEDKQYDASILRQIKNLKKEFDIIDDKLEALIEEALDLASKIGGFIKTVINFVDKVKDMFKK